MKRTSFKPLALSGAIILAATTLSGCSNFLAATHDGPVQQDPGQRSRGEKVDDKQIKTFLKVNLGKADPLLKKANINIESYNGVVLLTGEVKNSQLRELAGATARDIAAVRQVHNQIEIASESTFYSRANDSWLATKVRSKIVAAKVVEINRVKVIPENRTIYLMGLLTESEARSVVEVARTTEGVKKVVRAIELVPEHERAPL